MIVNLVWFLALFIAILILLYQRASLTVATTGISVLLLILSVLAPLSSISLLIIWGVWILFAVIGHVPWLRQRLISQWIMVKLAKHMPYFSTTEKAVLAAGNTGWEAELFNGMPDLNQLAILPWVKLTAAEQAFLAGPVAELCRMIEPWRIHQHQQIPEPIWAYLKNQGFFGLVIPEQYGGKGFSAFAHAQIVMKLASVSTAVATVTSVPNSLGPGELLLHYGAAEQKDYYLPRLARGEEIPCFALTSPVAGSDASAITDSGVVCRYPLNDKDTLGIRLNWDKRYITLAPVATLLGLAFRLYDPDHYLGEQEVLGITCALISTAMPGVQIGRHHNPLECAFPNGPTQGEDVVVPLDAIIGGVAQVGKGWQMLMERLAAGRSISLPSIVMGSMKIAAVTSGTYARIRRQFNTYIGSFGGVQTELARIAGYTYIAEAMRLFSIAQVDQGIHSATAAAMSKYHTTELGRQVITAAMDIHGGKGICMGPHNYLAQLHIESPIAITVEGANILTRSLIIFGQGLLRCHRFLFTEITAAQQSNKKLFDQAFFGHIGAFLSNQVRAFMLGLTNGRFSGVPRSLNRRYYQALLRFSAVLAASVDVVLLTTGAALKRKELLSARLGDLLSYLYMLAAVLKQHQMLAENAALLPLVEWSSQEILASFQQKLNELLVNLPNRWARRWLCWLIGPLAKSQRHAADVLTIEVAKLLMEPGPVRDNLAAAAFTEGALANLEIKLQQLIAVEPLLQKIHHAQHQRLIHGRNLLELIEAAQKEQIITLTEAQQLQAAELLRTAMVAVDDFE